MKSSYLLLFLIIAKLGLAQQKNVVDSTASGIIIEIPYGKLTAVDKMAVKITKVIDSRCPRDVECIRAGEVIVEMSIFENGIFKRNLEIHFNAVSKKENLLFKYDNWNMYGVSVSPYPKILNSNIKQEDYIFKVALEQNNDNQ